MWSPRRWRPEWFLAAGSLLACALALGLLEFALRFANPTYLDERPAVAIDRLHRYSEQYGWELRPGARQHDGDHWVSVNPQGYRGEPLSRRPETARQRVVLLGDSVTFGTYVGDGQNFADRLQAGDDGLEVVNLAVQGYGLDQELIRLEREGLDYEPQVVVANVCLANDFADIMLPVFLYDGVRPTPYYRLERGQLRLHDEHLRLGFGQRLGVALNERSHLFNRLLELRGSSAPDDADEHGSWVQRRAEALKNPQAALRLAVAILSRMRDVTEDEGARFVVVLHPDKPSFKGGSTWIDALAAASELRGVEMVDLGREYRQRGLRYGELMLDGIGHLSPLGHQTAAAILETRLRPTADARLATAPQL
jgi:lysophospholipase L1-like esterase